MPQLFCLSVQTTTDLLTLTTPALIHQITKVLRMQVGDTFFVQSLEHPVMRWHVSVKDIGPKAIQAQIIETSPAPTPSSSGMLIALPNKFEKIELIVQKLTEIGIGSIVFRPARRSLLREISSSKLTRLDTIAREAVEQSRGWQMPHISVVHSLQDLPRRDRYLFDHHTDRDQMPVCLPSRLLEKKSPERRGIIGPEGGLIPEDLEEIRESIVARVSLGDTILRTETAAMIGGWCLH